MLLRRHELILVRASGMFFFLALPSVDFVWLVAGAIPHL